MPIGFPQRNLLTGSQVWTGDPAQDAQASQQGFDALALSLQQLKNRTVWGVTDGSDALPGQIGEFHESTVTSIGSWSDGVVKNVTSLTLAAGDWEVSGAVTFLAGALTATGIVATISETSATEDLSTGGGGRFDTPTVPSSTFGVTCPTGPRRISISSTTTVYLTGRMAFTVGTPSANGYLCARRVR